MEDLWNRLKTTSKPIVLYGTGNGADKIMATMERKQLPLAGVFASDGFVRQRTFGGFPVHSYSQAKEIFGDMVVLLAFGSHRQDVIENIRRIAVEQELYAPDMALYGEPVVFDQAYYEDHLADIARARELLCDAFSRKVFDDVIAYRLSGKLSYLWDCETEDTENWKLLHLGNEERYLDLGAYTGDTVAMFCSCVEDYQAIYALEPDKRNYRKLTENTQGLHHCFLLESGISDKEEVLPFSKGTGRGGTIGKGENHNFTSVDTLLKDQEISFIKMDVEGQEMKALLGGENTIRAQKPKCLISAYHRIDDLWTLPLYIHSLNPNYQFYLRHSPCVPAWEVNYYIV